MDDRSSMHNILVSNFPYLLFTLLLRRGLGYDDDDDDDDDDDNINNNNDK